MLNNMVRIGSAVAVAIEGGYEVQALAGDDLFLSPDNDGARTLSATRFLIDAPETATFEFVPSAEFVTTFDSVALVGWQDDEHWFKLCLEQDPQGRNRIVSVVTKGRSDDANGPFVGETTVKLQCRRQGDFISLHYRTDDKGIVDLVRCFRLPLEGHSLQLGFTVQSPQGHGLKARIQSLRLSDSVNEDIRGFGIVDLSV
ncbi:DUF1349 domain-containing protein [Trueperella pyogenes]|uniref:DUF1349 domain-containing protein n=1 Tax=Trueperella pyogenes TaxID=1661 RepID=UPI000F84ED75|nr:DUF1349 domain-containing protein [Trueperella pyogenes]AZR03014.1 DUF1349 domain-containing protein [Trueperella pyogenes]